MTREQRSRMAKVREQVDEANNQLLELLNERTKLVEEIRDFKIQQGLSMFDPLREARQIQGLLLKNRGPMSAHMVETVFQEIFRASLSQMEKGSADKLLVKVRQEKPGGVKVGDVVVGGGNKPVIMAGPCAVEHEDSLEKIAQLLKSVSAPFIRGGAFKPRTSPYNFQGLGMEGVKMLARVAKRHGIKVVSELTDPCNLDEFIQHVDVVQVGARNMFNYDLLKRLGETRCPVLLKRSFAATVDEFFLAAEYLLAGGNNNVILCERGIRTFETATRNTLDISAVCLIKELTDLPVVVDISHAAGRRDLLTPLAKAALAAGADGIMVEVHPHPESALSDGSQQMTMDEFKQFVDSVACFLEKI
jgi:3-deoxy-7-phosphoheptulonate synthase / chorismate mutase